MEIRINIPDHRPPERPAVVLPLCKVRDIFLNEDNIELYNNFVGLGYNEEEASRLVLAHGIGKAKNVQN